MFTELKKRPGPCKGCKRHWKIMKEHTSRLRMVENRVLTRICGPKRDEIIGGWR
jgi:hypothetical protein